MHQGTPTLAPGPVVAVQVATEMSPPSLRIFNGSWDSSMEPSFEPGDLLDRDILRRQPFALSRLLANDHTSTPTPPGEDEH
jgi:hypothetical protein